MLRKSKSAAIGSGGLAPAGAIENLLAARFFPFRWKLARACGLLAGFCSLHACVGWCCLGFRCLRGVTTDLGGLPACLLPCLLLVACLLALAGGLALAAAACFAGWRLVGARHNGHWQCCRTEEYWSDNKPFTIYGTRLCCKVAESLLLHGKYRNRQYELRTMAAMLALPRWHNICKKKRPNVAPVVRQLNHCFPWPDVRILIERIAAAFISYSGEGHSNQAHFRSPRQGLGVSQVAEGAAFCGLLACFSRRLLVVAGVYLSPQHRKVCQGVRLGCIRFCCFTCPGAGQLHHRRPCFGRTFRKG